MFIIKFTLSNGKSHYGVRDFIKFKTYKEALQYCEEGNRRDPDCGHWVEEIDDNLLEKPQKQKVANILTKKC